jgi:glycosyltransferase involved in cell wall biosynthesis
VRVLTFVDRLSLQGGAERLAWLIATRLDRDRFDSTLCVSRWPPPKPSFADPSSQRALEALEQTGTGFLALARARKLDVGAAARLQRHLRRERIDVLHAHKFGSNVWAALAGRAARVPVVLAHEHTWSYEGRPLRRLLDREVVARLADRFIAVSREDQRRMAEVERIDPARTMFLPNGVPPFPPPTGHDARAELGLPSDAQLIATVGVLRPQKAHAVLVRAAALLAPAWPRLHVLIVGDGRERPALERLIGELGLGQVVHLLGHRTDVPDILRALDVAVCCSDFEGSPLAVMEYMEAARPIVATAVGGVPDLIDDRVHGLLVPPRDHRALADAIASLLADPEHARRLGASAQARRRAELDIATLVARLEDLYEELLEQKRARTRGRGDGR